MAKHPELKGVTIRNPRSPESGDIQDPLEPQSTPPGMLFTEAVEKYIGSHLRNTCAESTAKEKARCLRSIFVPRIGDRPINQITPQEIDQILQDMSSEGTPSKAIHAHADLRHFFNWHVTMRHLPVSPMKEMPPPAQPNKRTRYLKGLEIQAIWRATELEPYPLGHLAQLMLLTAQPRSAVAGMRYDELDLQGGVWTIPGHRTKNGEGYIVPLSNFAVEVLLKIHRVPLARKPDQPCTFSPYVFPRPRNPNEPMKWFSKPKARLEKSAAVDDWTLQDMRRTATTCFGAFRVDIKAQRNFLDHAASSVTSTDNCYEDFEPRCKAAHAWAEHVRKAIAGEVTSTAQIYKNPFLTIVAPGDNPAD